jgi:multidrug resistance efflux pump
VIDQVVAVPGDTVQAGEIVAQLYNADLKSDVASAEKELAGARANLEVAESRLAFLREQPTPEELRIAESRLEQSRINLEARKQDLERARHLYLGERLWSQEDLERAQTNYDLAQANLKVSVENLS